MKTAEQAQARAVTWLDRNLTAVVAAGDSRGLTIGLDAPSGQRLRDEWSTVRDWAITWRKGEPALPNGVSLIWEPRMLGSSRQELPVRLLIATTDAVAAWAGDPYQVRLATARRRWHALTAAFPLTATEATLKAVLDWTPVDWELLLSTTAWFAAHPAPDRTWTPRQVPVPGLHAKWLDVAGRRTLIARLAGLEQIELRSRPSQVWITYIDPDHVATGHRRWDIMTAGDITNLPYPPQTVLIVENRDTAFYFPPIVPSGVVVLGNGDAAVTTIATIAPLMSAARILYWGDIDAEGLRIVSRLRSRGHQFETILMDVATYDTYAPFGTNRDPSGGLITPGDPVPPPMLTPTETELYERLTDPAFTGYRRIEQERIPLATAADHLLALVTRSGTHSRNL